MDRFDEILKIFQTQQTEIEHLSTKVNQLEKANSFLLNVVESTNILPPVFDPVSIALDKNAAIQKEATYKSEIKENNKDSTQCDTTLNNSFDDSLLSDIEEQISNKLKLSNNLTIKNNSQINCTNQSDDSLSNSLSKSKLKVSKNSPIKRKCFEVSEPPKINESKIINTSNKIKYTSYNQSDDSGVSDKDNENEPLFDTVIAADKKFEIPKISSIPTKMHLFPKSTCPNTLVKSSYVQAKKNKFGIKISNNDDELYKALDFVIETLQNGTTIKQFKEIEQKTIKSPQNNKIKQSLECLQTLMKERNNLINSNDDDDELSRLKLLLTTQQLKSDMLHKSLENSNFELFHRGCELTQNNVSNNTIPTSSETLSTETIAEDKDKELKSKTSSIDCQSLKVQKQKELERINDKSKYMIQMTDLDEKTQNAFIKFTALVKGYIVRTLLQTDKVRNIIITIKDTAQMALNIRQERQSGDNSANETPAPLNNCRFNSRRTQQEALVFQQRLVAQLRAALREFHDIFFSWSTIDRVNLIRRHIDRLIDIAADKVKSNDLEDIEEKLNEMTNKSSLSSATLKRRQNLALREMEGNLKSISEESTVTSNFSKTQLNTESSNNQSLSVPKSRVNNNNSQSKSNNINTNTESTAIKSNSNNQSTVSKSTSIIQSKSNSTTSRNDSSISSRRRLNIGSESKSSNPSTPRSNCSESVTSDSTVKRRSGESPSNRSGIRTNAKYLHKKPKITQSIRRTNFNKPQQTITTNNNMLRKAKQQLPPTFATPNSVIQHNTYTIHNTTSTSIQPEQNIPSNFINQCTASPKSIGSTPISESYSIKQLDNEQYPKTNSPDSTTPTITSYNTLPTTTQQKQQQSQQQLHYPIIHKILSKTITTSVCSNLSTISNAKATEIPNFVLPNNLRATFTKDDLQINHNLPCPTPIPNLSNGDVPGFSYNGNLRTRTFVIPNDCMENEKEMDRIEYFKATQNNGVLQSYLQQSDYQASPIEVDIEDFDYSSFCQNNSSSSIKRISPVYHKNDDGDDNDENIVEVEIFHPQPPSPSPSSSSSASSSSRIYNNVISLNHDTNTHSANSTGVLLPHRYVRPIKTSQQSSSMQKQSQKSIKPNIKSTTTTINNNYNIRPQQQQQQQQQQNGLYRIRKRIIASCSSPVSN